METPSNVIPFPKSPTNKTRLKTKEEIDNRVKLVHDYHVQETIQAVAPELFFNLDLCGFKFDDEDEKCATFIIEAIKSVLYKQFGIFHPFQELAEQVFNTDPEDESSLKIVDSINLNLKNKSNLPEMSEEFNII